jgi:hypothetical protein
MILTPMDGNAFISLFQYEKICACHVLMVIFVQLLKYIIVIGKTTKLLSINGCHQ